MLIYFNGDSYTAGSGLFAKYLPEYPGNFTWPELQSNVRKKQIKRFLSALEIFEKTKFVDLNSIVDNLGNFIFYDSNVAGSIPFFDARTQIEKYYSYPAELSRIDKSINIINAARGGASMGGICNRTIIDLLNLKEENKIPDLVVIQLTAIERYEIYDLNSSKFISDSPLGYFRNKFDQDISSAILSKYKDEDFLVKYFYHLCSVKEVVYSITGKNPIFIDSCNGNNIESRINSVKTILATDIEKKSYFKNLLQFSMIDNAHLNFMHNFSYNIEQPLIWDGHYREEIHKLTAKKLHKIILEHECC